MKYAVTMLLLLGVMAPTLSGQSAQRPKKFLGGPLVIEDQGSFFIGGVPKVTTFASPLPPTPPGVTAQAGPFAQQITIGQMYVQFQIPATKYGAGWPVIMVHGSTHTGACLEATPDGREGWYPYFVRHGVPSYVVDQAGRGRSGFDQSVLHEAEAKLAAGDTKSAADLIPAFGRITDNGAYNVWFGHMVPAGTDVLHGHLVPHAHGEDTDPKPDAYKHVPPNFPIDAVDPNIVARKGAIGPKPTSAPETLALEYYKQLVPNAEVTLPGSICETCNPKEIAPANTWTPQNLAALVERLGGAIVVTHSQSGIMGHHMTRILKERGHLDLVKGLITLEGSCSLPNSGLTAADFDNIPYMALKGDYTATSNVCQDTVTAINARRAAKQGTAKAEYLKLDDMGILGVTHMMMLDKKNLEIADIIYNWVNKNVRKQR
jgi:hypothetical protein